MNEVSAGDLYGAISPWAQALIVALAGARSLASYRALPGARANWPWGGIGKRRPLVSIIVPARNEQRALPTLLPSLLQQDYPSIEVIVIDDASTDATSAIAAQWAARDPRLRVLRGNGPPPGWTGKNYACWQGAQTARGDWLLFTDADTCHESAALRSALAIAEAGHASAVSLFPRQRCEGFWERLLLPFAYQQYFVGTNTRTLARPNGPALANGQYFLISRTAYEAAGGHAAIAGSVIDDVALAGALKRAGYPTLVARGEALVSVRMYDSLGALAEGFTKNAAQFVQAQRGAGALVALATAANAVTLPALVTAAASGATIGMSGATVAYVAQCLALVPWMRSFGVWWGYALLAPLAALAFTGIALTSFAHALLRWPVRWKGRALAPTR
ncbi:MAG TPA: glycosyltransferase [Ktedonobacterales bacterium]|jgi:chlorobactene glucosyltransferase|nr:glycosyltransferase [Ktedonobacterales bacterium]